MWGIIVGIISGTLMSIQGVLNTGVTKEVGIWMAAAFVQATALLVCIAAWFFTGRQGSLIEILKIQPKYLLFGGAIGAFITYTVVKSMEKIGPAKAVMIIVTAQLLTAYLIELFGWMGVEKSEFVVRKVVAIIAMIAGFIVFQWEK